jgi:hypothetical protein
MLFFLSKVLSSRKMKRALKIKEEITTALSQSAVTTPIAELPTPTQISSEQAKEIGDKLGVDWNEIDLEQFRMGIMVEFEHGVRKEQQTDVTGNDLLITGKIAWVHLKELPDYYTRLKKMQGES